MRSSRYQPKHAKPSLHPTRSTMSAGLTAVLLPLCLTTPAFAEGEASASPTAATSTATVVPSAQPTSMRISGPEGGVSPGSHAIAVRLVDADGQYVAGESVEVQRWAGQAWQALGRVQTDAMGLAKQQFSFSATTKVRAVYAGSVYRGASVSPERTVLVGQKTSLRISGPTGAVSAGSHPVAVRLLADGAYVPNAYVRVERQTASGWEYLGKMITDGGGHAKQSFAFPTTTKVRAVYEGSATRTASVSPVLTVAVATFRQRALAVAAQQNGKPYRYGSVGPHSFDCSGLVKYSFAQAGKALPRTSGEMYRATQRISPSQKQPGDLIFMSSNGRIGHVAVYAGDGMMWDAPTAGRNVSKRRIYSSSYYVGRVN
jgi:cell wall-associated NlpC family hydrolase